VINVSWHEARHYADWLSRHTGKRYRLPTESEWEYAGRSGMNGTIWAGTSNEAELDQYAVYAANSKGRTAPVGQDQGRRPNAFGLYDLTGNVFEWVEDCMHPNYQGAPNDGTAWLEAGNGNCKARTLRGGSWLDPPDFIRASRRLRLLADARSNDIGFRLAEEIP
jgi:formylglycine-generating enzyme required for sulfatase activity